MLAGPIDSLSVWPSRAIEIALTASKYIALPLLLCKHVSSYLAKHAQKDRLPTSIHNDDTWLNKMAEKQRLPRTTIVSFFGRTVSASLPSQIRLNALAVVAVA